MQGGARSPGKPACLRHAGGRAAGWHARFAGNQYARRRGAPAATWCPACANCDRLRCRCGQAYAPQGAQASLRPARSAGNPAGWQGCAQTTGADPEVGFRRATEHRAAMPRAPILSRRAPGLPSISPRRRSPGPASGARPCHPAGGQHASTGAGWLALPRARVSSALRPTPRPWGRASHRPDRAGRSPAACRWPCAHGRRPPPVARHVRRIRTRSTSPVP